MAKYSTRNKSASEDQAKAINVSENQSYEFRRERGFVTVRYYFHGQKWEDWAVLMATKEMKGAQMSFFLGAKYDVENKTMFMRDGFAFGVWLEKFARRFDGVKFVLMSDKGVKLGIPSDDDELKYFINGIEIGEIIHRSDERQAELDAEKRMPEAA